MKINFCLLFTVFILSLSASSWVSADTAIVVDKEDTEVKIEKLETSIIEMSVGEIIFSIPLEKISTINLSKDNHSNQLVITAVTGLKFRGVSKS